MKKYIIGATLITVLISFPVGWYLGSWFDLSNFFSQHELTSPLIDKLPQRLPLLKYRIEDLANFHFQPSLIVIEKNLKETPQASNFLFSYQTLNKHMTGQLQLPPTVAPQTGFPVIIMLRGWVEQEKYQTGVGTKAAAAVLAENGYLTLAPDFFGYGESDAPTDNSWEARFQKPINVIELIKTIQKNPQIKINNQSVRLNPSQIGIWAHSNGGQIALTTLEILQEPIPTTLWAPVTAPFPYSILFFSDEQADEGKKMRQWLAKFEEDYDVLDFSLTQHLDRLTGSLQLHQGGVDEAVPVSWSDEFVQKIEAENKKREQRLDATQTSTQSTGLKKSLPLIKLDYFKYPDADHNLRPNWEQVVQRDVEFFSNFFNKTTL